MHPETIRNDSWATFKGKVSAEELLVSAAKSRKGVLAVIGLRLASKSPALMQAPVISLE